MHLPQLWSCKGNTPASFHFFFFVRVRVCVGGWGELMQRSRHTEGGQQDDDSATSNSIRNGTENKNGTATLLQKLPQRRGGKSGGGMQTTPRCSHSTESESTEFVYTPHTLTALVFLISVFLVMIRYYYYPDMNVTSSVKLGLVAAAVSFVVFGTIHLPDSLLVRPHPYVWRAVLAVAVLYLGVLSFLLFQNLEMVRTIMGLYDPVLLEPLPEMQYAGDCRLFTPTDPFLFIHTAIDIFTLAHAVGYFFKALILRDWRIVTCVSIGFEIIEITFQHVLPNFKECWWDHVLLDVLLCNAGGTLLGILTLRKLRAKEFHWVALKNVKGYRKAKRILNQLCPRSFESYEWNVFLSPQRFLQCAALLGLFFLQEVNCFTMKHILHMSPTYHLVTLRLVVWGLIGIPAVREFYDYINRDSESQQFGTAAWVSLLILLLETIFIAKLAVEGKYFQELMPTHIALPWMAALLLFTTWFVVFFGVISLKERLARKGVLYAISNVLFYASCCCILALFLMGMPDLQLGRLSFEQFFAPYERSILFWR